MRLQTQLYIYTKSLHTLHRLSCTSATSMSRGSAKADLGCNLPLCLHHHLHFHQYSSTGSKVPCSPYCLPTYTFSVMSFAAWLNSYFVSILLAIRQQLGFKTTPPTCDLSAADDVQDEQHASLQETCTFVSSSKISHVLTPSRGFRIEPFPICMHLEKKVKSLSIHCRPLTCVFKKVTSASVERVWPGTPLILLILSDYALFNSMMAAPYWGMFCVLTMH